MFEKEMYSQEQQQENTTSSYPPPTYGQYPQPYNQYPQQFGGQLPPGQAPLRTSGASYGLCAIILMAIVTLIFVALFVLFRTFYATIVLLIVYGLYCYTTLRIVASESRKRR